MGINALLPYLKKFSKNVKLGEFSGKVAAVDASCWLHKDVYVALSQTGNRERTTAVFSRYLELFKNCGVTPLIVFDGRQLPAKSDENSKRRREREERLQKAKLQCNEANVNRLLGQGASITYEDVCKCIKLCLHHGIEYIVSPYESDAQIAYLLKEGFADLAVTEDSDLIAYDCDKVLTKLGLNGEGEFYCLSEILNNLEMDKDQFLNGCIVAGCDYLKNVRGVGIYKAFGIVRGTTMFDDLKQKGSCHDYELKFGMAKAVFLHQTVIDVSDARTKPLNKWDAPPSKELQRYCGDLLPDEITQEVAAGNIDFATGKKMNSFPLLKKKKKSPRPI